MHFEDKPIFHLRQEHLNAFEKNFVSERFENQILEYLTQFFPKQNEILGETQMRRVIRYGIKQAKDHGFTTERNIYRYINLMLMLGSHFDTDLQLPWRTTCFKETALTTQTPRMNHFYNKAMAYLDRVAGINNEYLNQALIKTYKVLIRQSKPVNFENFAYDVIIQFRNLWPEKYEEISQIEMHHWVQYGLESSRRYSITRQPGILTYLILMSIFGSDFDKDPQFYQFHSILNYGERVNQETKISQLNTEALHYLNNWL